MQPTSIRSVTKTHRIYQFLYRASVTLGIIAVSFVSGFSPFKSSFPVNQRQCRQSNIAALLLSPYETETNASSDKNEGNYLKQTEFDECLSRRQILGRTISLSTTFFFPMPSIAISDGSKILTDMTNLRSTSQVSTKILPEPSSFDESLTGFIAGAALAGTKTLVKFPLDTATVRVQMKNSNYSVRDLFSLFNGCYNGLSLTLLSNIPAGAVFFAVKDSVKTSIKNSPSTSTMPMWLSTSFAVAAGQIPYWLVRNPSEVVKVRQQAGIEGYGEGVSAIDAVKLTLLSNENGTINDFESLSELYTGYWENILYAYPADVIKFVSYESITKGRKDLSPAEGAIAGAIATVIAQIVTTPLDVVRNRIMTGKNGYGNGNDSSLSEKEKNKGYIESLIALGKEEGLSGLFAGLTPRVGKAFLSGAIQFATYEETKQSVSKFLLQK
mmetsp:Transcript_8160/g.9486  ORF Transcript_8160/g.9486 Transcript_8160/m.9486 type:complete len:440 (-) Transcript_8160:3-1322(-)